MVRRLIGKLLCYFQDRPLPPPSVREEGYLAELKSDFLELPTFETANVPASEAQWLSHMNSLRELVLTRDPREFLRWDLISRTMFERNSRYLLKELEFVRGRPDWESRWRAAIRESRVGRPLPSIYYPAGSGNLIHHAYHVAQFEEKTKVPVQEVEVVLEFGGGYGSMCRLFHNLGFRGKYIIYDLPSFSALQKYFLRTNDLPVRTPFETSGAGIFCVSDPLGLAPLLSEHHDAANGMFLATWSLSESPIFARQSVMPYIAGFGSFLIAYQERFGEVDNIAFFSRWKKDRPDIHWHNWEIEHIPGSLYLIGTVKVEAVGNIGNS